MVRSHTLMTENIIVLEFFPQAKPLGAIPAGTIVGPITDSHIRQQDSRLEHRPAGLPGSFLPKLVCTTCCEEFVNRKVIANMAATGQHELTIQLTGFASRGSKNGRAKECLE